MVVPVVSENRTPFDIDVLAFKLSDLILLCTGTNLNTDNLKALVHEKGIGTESVATSLVNVWFIE